MKSRCQFLNEITETRLLWLLRHEPKLARQPWDVSGEIYRNKIKKVLNLVRKNKQNHIISQSF